MYHANLIGDCETFINIEDRKMWEITDRLNENFPENLSGDDKIVHQMMLIRSKLDQLLSWMRLRLDGQKYWNHTINQTVDKAQELLAKAVE